jgi:hypothetical protein
MRLTQVEHLTWLQPFPTFPADAGQSAVNYVERRDYIFRRAAQLHTMSNNEATMASTTEEVLRRHVKCFFEGDLDASSRTTQRTRAETITPDAQPQAGRFSSRASPNH